jgi:hypothetical protein
MSNALASSYPKRLIDQQRVFAEITVLRQSDFQVRAKRSVLGLVLAVAPMHYEESSSHSNILVIGPLRGKARHLDERRQKGAGARRRGKCIP